MKVICEDNFNRENVSEIVVVDNVDEVWANKIKDALNRVFSGDRADKHYRVEKDDYKPYVFEP